MDLSLVISMISLGVALFIAIYSVYNIERDNAKVEAWAEVIDFQGFYRDKNDHIRILIVTVANVGRRPIIIKGFKVETKTKTKNKTMSFDIPAKQPDEQLTYDINSITDFDAVNDEIRSYFATKNTCVVLKEGEFFERELVTPNYTNDLVAFIDDELYEGENIYIQDVRGRLYPVHNFKNKLEIFQKEK